MRISTKVGRRLLPLLVVLPVSAVGFRTATPAAAVSGVFTLTYVRPSVAKGMNASGASVFISTASGVNRNTGQSKYLVGARVVNVDTAAMVQGNGSHIGHATFTEGSNTVVKRFTGTLTTRMSGGKPESTFKGKWTIIRGTGKYAGMTGSGTYSGRFETGTKYAVDWKGNTSM